ncbi:hypothetical protein [Blastochloris sulfoviridis]|uniref:hypothetical protein n=1 Tax=Blastochloris sulfoviridis TaxID=50712 RepID=UPI0014790F0C|nr:hypothetical protein [Blastochloris sulfoviridis]
MRAYLQTLVPNDARDENGGRLVESSIALSLVVGLAVFALGGVRSLEPMVAAFGILLR